MQIIVVCYLLDTWEEVNCKKDTKSWDFLLTLTHIRLINWRKSKLFWDHSCFIMWFKNNLYRYVKIKKDNWRKNVNGVNLIWICQSPSDRRCSHIRRNICHVISSFQLPPKQILWWTCHTRGFSHPTKFYGQRGRIGRSTRAEVFWFRVWPEICRRCDACSTVANVEKWNISFENSLIFRRKLVAMIQEFVYTSKDVRIIKCLLILEIFKS